MSKEQKEEDHMGNAAVMLALAHCNFANPVALEHPFIPPPIQQTDGGTVCCDDAALSCSLEENTPLQRPLQSPIMTGNGSQMSHHILGQPTQECDASQPSQVGS